MEYLYNLGLYYKHICRLQGDRIAIHFCDSSTITFAALDALSDQFAQCLVRKGVTRRQVVAIQNHKTVLGYACMLACLKLGAAYTNFDSANPKDRLSKIFTTAQPSIVVSDTPMATSVRELCEETHIPMFDCSYPEVQQDIYMEAPVFDIEWVRAVHGDDPAYIMFTSGSTGIPKGVVVRHGAVIHFVLWCKETFGITPSDNLTNVNPIYFDNSVFDFFASIFNGASLTAFPLDLVAHPAQMLETVERMECSFWFSVPSMLIYLNSLKLLTHHTFKHIRAFAFGGEGYPKEALKKLFDLYQDHAVFFNVYGPTEGTCMCSAMQVSADDFQDMHGLPALGRIAPNFGYLIMDEEGHPSRMGELYLGGPQLALGYYNDPERTSKSFVANPLNNAYSEVLYKTGDCVEIRDDGRLYFLGRVDNQVKHMGYRIELEEIEAGLMRLPYVVQGAVVHGKNEHGFSHLTAYLACREEIVPENVRSDLRKYLPEYMVPNHFEFLVELPKNANGKVDRQKLKKWAGLQ